MSDDSISFHGSNVTAGNIGGHDNTAHITGVNQAATTESAALHAALAELRGELIRLREALPRAGGADADRAEVDGIIDVIDADEPDIVDAASRWARLQQRIPESLRSLDGLGRIVDLMEKVQQLTM
ncbi:hypothetical protein [Nocardia sp. NPDC050406]|uniref:hypothetical protein n=1 Tax=Nocardia sp. NPDC050406 TaxID=3364318 RepID=UPI0037AAA532